MKSGLALVVVAWLFAFALPRLAVADQATGKVQATARGSFTLDDNGTLRLFSLSSKQTAYDPATWRPTVGDQVDVQFVVNKGVLVVGQVKLLEAGPNTLADLASPATVTIVEKGRSGILAKLESGQTVKFAASRGTAWEPAGWLPTPGETAVVEFQALKERFGFGVVFEAVKIAKKTAE